MPEVDERPFYLGHPAMKYTQIPARDGTAHGNIKRSNRYPNCSFFTSWNSENDSITWPVIVPEEGNFKVPLYYTCAVGNEGSVLQLSFGSARLKTKITEAYDPPLKGMEKDLAPRIESYVKDWKVKNIGNILLDQGEGTLRLKALNIPAEGAIDFRLLMFERLEL